MTRTPGWVRRFHRQTNLRDTTVRRSERDPYERLILVVGVLLTIVLVVVLMAPFIELVLERLNEGVP